MNNWQDNRFGNMIRDARKRRGMKAKELAAEISKTAAYINVIERCGIIPSPGIVVALAAALNVPTAVLITVAKEVKIERAKARITSKFYDTGRNRNGE